MGSPALEKVRSDALNLSEAERAELAYNLVVSLDGPPDSKKKSSLWSPCRVQPEGAASSD